MSSQVSLYRVQRKLAKVFLLDREPLRRRLVRLQQEFEKLAQEKADATSQTGNAPQNESQALGKIGDTAFERWEKRLRELADDCDASIEKVERRRKSFPKITYDVNLPVSERRDELKKLIAENQVVVVCGETGSGKSTQLPKICLELGLGARGLIGHTQPRRLAARSIAQRVADELQTPLGQHVGYKVRFSDETSDKTLIKLMTDGILLAESQNDRFFNRYEVVIVDEAHERSLNIDFLLGMMKRVLRTRRDLKLIITSATIDAKRFAEHFTSSKGPAPIIEISGRTYPIETLYRPIDEWKLRREERERENNADFEERNLKGHNDLRRRELDDEDAFEKTLLEAVDELARRERGDMLIFMPTERDIFETAKLLKKHEIPGDDSRRKTEILPLYARLPSTEQQKIFGKTSWRKIVVATNVAESSLTVPGIRYVIDPGTARISRYSARSKTQRLPIEPISQASADQRAGRCGRVGPGVCIRLYSERDYLSRPRYTTPEIQRTNLASVILQTKALKLGAVERFPFIDPPRNASIIDGYKTLFELGAVDENNELTEIGRKLSRLPIDPRIGRMIFAADEEDALREILIIAGALEIQDPRERPREQQEKADEKHAPFLDENSDFMSYLKLWDFWQNLKDKTSRNQLRKACRENFLSFNRMREWSDVYVQLLQLVKGQSLEVKKRRDDYNAIHRSVLTGLLYGVAQKEETGNEYRSTNAGKFVLWPGSGLKKKPAWAVGAERLETTRAYLRTVARINPDWIEEIGGRLLERTRRDPFWNRETGCVHAYERATLYGLTIIPKRRVNFGPIDPVKSRQIFIYEALVNRDFDCSLPFFEHNCAVFEEAERLRDKLRKYDFVKSLDSIYDFYDAKLPDTVYDAVSLKKWWKKAPQKKREALFAKLDDFCAGAIDAETAAAFPDEATFDGSSQLPLKYRFSPGDSDDGASLIVPLEGLRQLETRRLGWLIPGLVEQKIVAMLKTLPKEIRREIVPIPDTAREIVKRISFGDGSLEEVVAQEVSRLAGRRTTVADFDLERTPPELLLNLKVVDDAGELLAEGRDAGELRERLGVEMNKSIGAVVDPQWNRDGLTTWDFGTLPESISIARGSLTVSAYPALCDPRFLTNSFSPSAPEARTVATRLFDSKDKAFRYTKLGVIRLFNLANSRDLKTQARWLPQLDKLQTFSRAIADFDLTSAIAETIGARALDLDDATSLPANEGEFNDLAKRGRERIGYATQDVAGWIVRFLENYQEARLAIEKRRGGAANAVAVDAASHLARLTEPRFYLTTPWNWLKEFPRYFKAISARFEKWQNGGAATDAAFARELNAYWERYCEALERNENAGIFDPELETFRWALEEYRVSLFAQKLGTAMKISAVRLEKQWEKTAR